MLQFRHGSSYFGADFRDYNSQECSIQESSLANHACLWLGVNNVIPKVRAEIGWEDVPLPFGALTAARMHLTQDQVRELLPLLQHFAEHGELPRE